MASGTINNHKDIVKVTIEWSASIGTGITTQQQMMNYNEILEGLRELADFKLEDKEDIELINETILFLSNVKYLAQRVSDSFT